MKTIIKYLILILVVLTAASTFAQTRDDTNIYIAPVVARADQAVYFKDSFTIETVGAGYNVTENLAEADYVLKLEVRPNMVLYDDGTEEQAPPDEPQFILQIVLVDTQTNNELVSFSYAFTEVEEMNEFNLFLVYEAMANVPLTKLIGVEIVKDPELWRDKWIYLHAAFSYPIVTYELKNDAVDRLHGGNSIYNPGPPFVYSQLAHKVSAIPGLEVGLEFQFLDWMSTELLFSMAFGDPNGYSFIPGLGLQLKFPIKPANYFMLEPYLAINATLNTSNNYTYFAAGGGFQIGVKGGEMGALVMDVNFSYALSEMVMRNNSDDFPKPDYIHWNSWKIGLSIGYKIGFANRKK